MHEIQKERYLNCKYLDAGMDSMLCSIGICTTCKEFNGEKCSYFEPKENINEIEQRQIEEMSEDLTRAVQYDIENTDLIDSYDTAVHLFKQGYRNCKDKVVLSKEEYVENGDMYLMGKEEMERYFDEVEIPKARKEIAREIINWFRENSICIPSNEDINEFAKRYGVEEQ